MGHAIYADDCALEDDASQQVQSQRQIACERELGTHARVTGDG